MPSASIRLQPRAASSSQILEVNERLQVRGVRLRLAPLSSEDLEETRRPRPTLSHLRAWIWHPDERLPVEAAANAHVDWQQQRGKTLGENLFLRALWINEQEGLLWNPLLDALDARSGSVPAYGQDRWSRFAKIRGEVEEDFPYLPAQRPANPDGELQSIKSRLQQAISQDTSGNLALDLLHSRSPAVRQMAVRGAPVVKEEMMEAVIGEWKLLPSLLSNRALLTGQVRRLQLELRARLGKGEVLLGEGRERVNLALLVRQMVQSRHWEAEDARSLLLGSLPAPTAGEDGWARTKPLLLEALSLELAWDEKAQRRLLPYLDDWIVRQLLRRVRKLAPAVLEAAVVLPDLSEAALQLLAVYHPELCDRGGFMERLPFKYLSADFRRVMLERGHGVPFRASFLAELAEHPLPTLQKLEARSADARVCGSLYPADLASVLAHEDARIREQAIRLVGQLSLRAFVPLPKRRPPRKRSR